MQWLHITDNMMRITTTMCSSTRLLRLENNMMISYDLQQSYCTWVKISMISITSTVT